MARDLDLPVRIVGVPTVREPDGLAMSSRNRFLAPAERALAPRLYAEMRRAAAAIAGGAPVAEALAEAVAGRAGAGVGVDYFALVEAETMRPLDALPPPSAGAARLVAAARLGTVRPLENLAVPPERGHAGWRSGRARAVRRTIPPAPAPVRASLSQVAPGRSTPPGCG